MSQTELNRAVSRATGESVATVKRLGFLLAKPTRKIRNPESEIHGPQVIDWDELDSSRHVAVSGRRSR